MAFVTVDWDPEPFVIAASYVTLGASMRSFREPLTRSVQKVAMPSIGKNFDSEGRPSWPALSDATIEQREREGYGAGPILDRTGSLRGVATSQSIWEIDEEKAQVTDLPQDVWYGKVHQRGAVFTALGGRSPLRAIASVRSGASSGVIPERPFLMLQEEDVEKIQEVFIDWIRERCAFAGFIPGP